MTINSVSQPYVRGSDGEEYEGGASTKCTIGTQTDDRQVSLAASKAVKGYIKG